MAISRRRLRFRLRFGFGLAALAIGLLATVPSAAFAAPPKPKPTPASDQYTTPVTTVTLNAARIGKCKLAVIRFYAPKLKRCKTKACRAAVGKSSRLAQGRCTRAGMTATEALRPAVKRPATKGKKPTRKVTTVKR